MDPNDEAFCTILWEANGGKLDFKGRPIFADDSRIIGRCKQPGDCDKCSHMQLSIRNLIIQGAIAIWICPTCVGQIKALAQEFNIQFKLPGFYTEGFCQRPKCIREDDDKYSIILQLLTVIGSIIP